MPKPRQDNPSLGRRESSSTSIALYTDLLAANERSAGEGRPLLTDAGVCYVRQALTRARSNDAGRPHFKLFDLLPFWDGEARQMWLGNQLLKEFRQAASNQVAILSEFQKRGWACRRIDDPLVHEPTDTAKERRQHLYETVKNLNRDLQGETIRFRVEVGGMGVRWEHCVLLPQQDDCAEIQLTSAKNR
jgi:hypothetical protein